MEFKSPFSRIEAILQNILGADNVLEDPLSRAEVILLAILNDTVVTEELNYDELSELEALLYAIKESDEEYDEVPETRSGKILLKILHGEKYEGETESRVEELLKEWSHAAAWYTKTVGPGNPINVTDALAEPAVGLKVTLSPIQESTPWIDTVADTKPYLLRSTETTGNTADEKLVGGSVVWNQLVDYANILNNYETAGIVRTKKGNGVFHFEGTSSSASYNLLDIRTTVVSGHKYGFFGYDNTGSQNNYVYNGFPATYNVFNKIVVANADYTGTIFQKFVASADKTLNGDLCIIVVDLTQMFANNPAIADYIYSLEQTEAGSGIAWLKSYGFFTKDYYPRNPGEIMSMKAYSKKVVGFNQWDEEWELGNIDNATGADTSPVNNRIKCKNYIPVIGGISYCFHCGDGNKMALLAYDVNKSFIGVYYNGTFSVGTVYSTDIGKDTIITLPANARYIRIKCIVSYGTTYNNNICINLSDPNRNGEYEPYKEQTYELGNDELRGLFKLDTTTNKLYTDGDIKTSDGEIDRKYRLRDFGESIWTQGNRNNDDTGYIFRAGMVGNKDRNTICEKYTRTNVVEPWEKMKVGEFAFTTQYILICADYVDANAFKTAMSGVHVLYELATPTTETSTPFTNPQDVYAGGTEEFVDERTIPIPVGHETIYSNVQEITGYDGITITHGINETDPNPTEYQVLFQSIGTVYSGSLDVLRGVLTVDMAEVDLGTLNWIYRNDGIFTLAQRTLDVENSNFEIICSKYTTHNVHYTFMNDKEISSSGGFIYKDITVKDTTYTDATTFKSAMSGVQLVYELATPLTYNLTQVEVEMLLNSNYLKSNGGVMTLTYKGTNPAILLMNKLRTSALMRKTKEIQNGNLQPILPKPKL